MPMYLLMTRVVLIFKCPFLHLHVTVYYFTHEDTGILFG
jgi:hypothetical protein